MKNILRRVLYKIKHPHVDIQNNAVVGGRFVSGIGVSIHSHAFIYNVSIDGYSYIGDRSQIQNARIGKFCSIAPEVRVGLGRHPTNYVSTYPGTYSTRKSGAVSFGGNGEFREHMPVSIGNDVYIGARAMILDGVDIGDGAVVASGAVVVKDVPPYAIVGGVPAQIIKYRFKSDIISGLLKIRWWDWEEAIIRRRIQVFTDPEAFVQEFCCK